jgi:hypothetical protein
VLDGCRLNQLLLAVFNGDALRQQLRGEPARQLNNLPSAVASPCT